MRRQRTFPFHPCIFVGWDNTARRGRNGIVVINSTPKRFARGLREMARSTISKPEQERLLFLNAWNEWAEGNHLEPDQRCGLSYLEAVKLLHGQPRLVAFTNVAGLVDWMRFSG